MVLYNGTSYEEMIDEENKSGHPLVRSKFKEQEVRFDLSGFRMVRSEEELFRSSYGMLNIWQIDKMIDSMETEQEKKKSAFRKNFSDMLSDKGSVIGNKDDTARTRQESFRSRPNKNIAALQQQNASPKISNANAEKARVIDVALSIARSKKYYIESLINELGNYDRPVISLNVEWHKKFTLSIACLILFFVGAPLGAIIRKGGLGMPVVVSVVIFILFWVVTITGEKMSKEGALPPYIGMWIATAVTLPLGIFLTRKATSDSALFDTDSYLKPFQKLFRKIK